MRTSIAFVLAAGCLSTPPRPADPDAATDAAPIDGPAGPCEPGWDPPGADAPAPFPAGTIFRTVAVARLAGDAIDDVLLLGQEGPGAADRRALYVAYGHPGMGLRCHDLAVDLGAGATPTEVLDLAIADATGEGNPDVVVLTRETAPTSKLVVRLFAGASDGTFSGQSKTTVDGDAGGTLGAPQPAHVVVRRTDGGGHQIVFGGLGGLWTSEVSGTQLLTPKAVSPLMVKSTVLGNIQDIVPIPAASGGEHVLVINQSAAFDFAVTTPTTFALSGASRTLDSGPSPRFVRAGLATATSIEAMSCAAQRVDLIAVPPLATTSFSSPDVPAAPRDAALTRLVDDAGRDVIVLGRTALAVELAVFLGTQSGTPTDILHPATPLLAGDLLAVGDFDGDPLTPRTFFVVPATVSANAPTCLRVAPGLSPSLVGC